MSQLKFRSLLATNELIGNFCTRKRKSYLPYVKFGKKNQELIMLSKM
jgi:hypothetical protein